MPAASFSIVIPTYNRPERLAECLRSICALDYDPQRFEVIVVDDDSPQFDRVQRAVEPFIRQIDLRLLQQPHAGPAAARNLGASAAKHDYIAFTDDDCRTDPQWLAAFERQFAQHPGRLLGGRTINALSDNACAAASQALVSFLNEYYMKKGAPFFASNNIALARQTLERVGGFDLRFPLAGGEDREFCARYLVAGCQLTYAADAVITHYHALTLKRFLRQHYNYGRGAYCYRKVHVARGGSEVRFEPLGFYASLIGYPLTAEGIHQRGRVTLLMLASQFANVTGYFREKFSRPQPD